MPAHYPTAAWPRASPDRLPPPLKVGIFDLHQACFFRI